MASSLLYIPVLGGRMKGYKFKHAQELGLAEVKSSDHSGRLETTRLVELEWQMTNFSFAHHYALSAIVENSLSHDENEGLLEDVEKFKGAYFSAREEYAGIDVERLDDFESSLVAQKAILSVSGVSSMAH
jgi:hypothetical protein